MHRPTIPQATTCEDTHDVNWASMGMADSNSHHHSGTFSVTEIIGIAASHVYDPPVHMMRLSTWGLSRQCSNYVFYIVGDATHSVSVRAIGERNSPVKREATTGVLPT